MNAKTLRLFALSLIVAISLTLSACGDGAKKVWNSCDDVTTCAVDTPRIFAEEVNKAIAPACEADPSLCNTK